MIELENITKVYRMGKVEVPALRGVTLNVEPKEMVAIIMNQKEPLNQLMTMLEVHAANEDVKSTIDDLKILHEIFNSIDAGSITIDQLDAIEKNVAVLREKYVS